MLKRLRLFLIACLTCGHFAVASDNCPATVIDTIPFFDNIDLCAQSGDVSFGLCGNLPHDVIYSFVPSETGLYGVTIVNAVLFFPSAHLAQEDHCYYGIV